MHAAQVLGPQAVWGWSWGLGTQMWQHAGIRFGVAAEQHWWRRCYGACAAPLHLLLPCLDEPCTGLNGTVSWGVGHVPDGPATFAVYPKESTAQHTGLELETWSTRSLSICLGVLYFCRYKCQGLKRFGA